MTPIDTWAVRRSSLVCTSDELVELPVPTFFSGHFIFKTCNWCLISPFKITDKNVVAYLMLVEIYGGLFCKSLLLYLQEGLHIIILQISVVVSPIFSSYIWTGFRPEKRCQSGWTVSRYEHHRSNCLATIPGSGHIFLTAVWTTYQGIEKPLQSSTINLSNTVCGMAAWWNICCYISA
jgi:hypothetical protein